jgi:hypothetical protein
MKRQTLFCAAAALLIAAPASADPAPGEVLARAGGLAYTTANLSDVLALDEGVLESPLSGEERAAVQDILVAEFQAKPAEIAKFAPVLHQNAELFRHGRVYEQAVARESYWESVLKQAPTDRFIAAWLEIMRRHAPILAEGGGMVVTQPELAAMFATEDVVAEMAGQPRRSAADRKALAEALAAHFAAMPAAEKATYAHAERRRAALLGNILAYSDLRAKAVGLVKAAVHGPEDVPPEARSLENDGMQFAEIGERFTAQQVQVIQGIGKLNSVEGINSATRQFWGQGR